MAKKEKEVNKKQKGHFFKDMKAELKKVIWPSPKQLVNNTLAVIAFTLIVAVVVFVLDVCFDAINKNGVVALQEKIKSSYSASNTTDDNASSDEDASNEDGESKAEENATTVEVETNTESQE